MKQVKPWYKSTTLWGIFIAAIGFGLSHWGVDVSALNLPPNPDAQTVINTAEKIKDAHGSITGIISVIASALGSLIAIWGRITATKAVGVTNS